MSLARSLTVIGASLLCLSSCQAPGPNGGLSEGSSLWSGEGRPRPLRPLRSDSERNNGHSRDCDWLHLDLELEVDFPERRVTGIARHRLRGLQQSSAQVTLHGEALEIHSVRNGAGQDLAYKQFGPELRIDWLRPLLRDQERELEVSYSAQPKKGLYFRDSSKDFEGSAPQVWSQGQDEDNRHWIPVWDYPNDRGTFAAHITVGEGMTALSNGRLVSTEPGAKPDTQRFHWELERELPAYLIALACGRWERYADDWNGHAVEYYVAPGTGEEKARRAFGETPEVLEYFSNLLDEPYPYGKYAQVAVAEFIYGGMENTTLTIQNDYLIGTEDEVADLDGDPRLLVAHEAAHQWFGDLLTCFGWSHLWLNEAFASFLELKFQEHKEGRENARLWYERYREIYLARGERTRLPVSEDWRSQVTRERSQHLYDKGPWVLYMLEQQLGREDFWRGVRSYVDRFGEGLVTSTDFQRAIFDTTGHNIEGFLEQWVHAGGHPVYRVRYEASSSEARSADSADVVGNMGRLELRVQQVQDTDELVPLFDNRVQLEVFYTSGRSETHELLISERKHQFKLPLSGALADLRFDSNCQVLCEIDLEKPVAMWIRQANDMQNSAGRWRAIRELSAFARAGDRDRRLARAALVRILSEDPEPMLRRLAAEACRFTGGPESLLNVLGAESNPLVRRAAAESLATFRLEAVHHDLIQALLKSERSPAVRRVLLGALPKVAS